MKNFSPYQIARKLGLDEDQIYLFLTLLTGVLAGLFAVLIHKSIYFLTDLAGTNKPFGLKQFLWGGGFLFVSGFLSTRVFTKAGGSGIPQVRIALAVYHGKLSIKETFGRLLASILSLSSGVTLGRVGPTVAISSGIGSYLASVFHLSKKRVKALVAVGSAGGFAAAFNTPISAVVFTLEEVVGDLNAKMLGSIVISSVIAAVTATLLHDNVAAFEYVKFHFRNVQELSLFFLVGLLAAVIGPLWTKSILVFRSFSLKLYRGHRLSLIMSAFILVGLCSHVSSEILGGGTTVINEKFLTELLTWQGLVKLLALKFALTTICFASGISGGLLIPTIFMGAILGSGFNLFVESIFPGFVSDTSVYALVGMGAFFASVIRTPFTSIIMIFELTRSYEIIFPLMVANIVSYAVSSKIQKESIYESISEQDGIHLPNNNDDKEVLESLIIEDAMVKAVMTFNHSVKVIDAFQCLKETKISGFPIMKGNKLYGMVSSQDIARAYAKGHGEDPIDEICTKNIICVYPDQNLTIAFHYLKKFNISRLPVVSRLNDKNLIGIITAEDIVNRFGFHIEEENKYAKVEEIAKAFDENVKKYQKPAEEPQTHNNTSTN